ncbi:MAG TPA: aldehyde dehydrogenase family protein [Bryobacteraceae bacterium]|nr:aldehyde dehydrogenase family protein [Bryobacteraceae bacterium]
MSIAEPVVLAEAVKRGLKPGRLFIDGREEDAAGGQSIDVVNPATGELLTTVPDGDIPDVDRAVAAARRSFEAKSWRGLDPSRKEKILWNLADILLKNKEELSVLESMENGKTVREASGADVEPAIDAFRYYAGWVRKIYGETIPVDGPYLNYTLREPVGVVGAIVPWNYPLQIAAWKVAPALACGCSVVLKPSEMTPLTALKLAGYCLEAGVPEGVVNVVTGYGHTAGEALGRHMDVDKISFTGSIRTARALLKASAESNLKRLSLELGGKSPNIIFPDCDREAALKSAFWGIFANKGEVCSAGSRLLLHADIHDQFLDELVSRAQKLKLGDPLDKSTTMGSQISAAQLERILGYIRTGQEEGARLLCGGARDTEGRKAKGFYVKPTIFSEVKPRMKIAQEEIFGPVLAALRFRDADEAVEIANSTIYGLVSAVWTRDIQLAHRVARDIKAGVVWINTYNGFDTAAPFGGYKQSGFGRDLGAYALEQYTNMKSVWVAL